MRKEVQANNIHVNALREELRQYLKTAGISGLQLSVLCGVGQTVIWRFLNGDTQKATGKVRIALNYANIDLNKRIILSEKTDPMDNLRLRQAVTSVCGGRPERVALLVRVVEAIGPLIHELSIEQNKEAL